MNIIKLFPIILLSNFIFASSLFDFEFTNYKSENINLKELNPKAILVVNIATRCGYTGQLDDLEVLYQKYKAKGLVIIGIPSNDFAGQSPEGNEEIAKFCKLNYGVTFPITLKQIVSGNEKNDLYKFIQSNSGNEIKWNFEKVLFDAAGKYKTKFTSSVGPADKKLAQEIEKLVN